MSRRLPSLSYREILRALMRAGFRFDRQDGSHLIVIRRDADQTRKAVVPRHKTVKCGTLVSILKQAGMSREEFLDYLAGSSPRPDRRTG